MTRETIGERIVRLRGAMSQTELANRIKAITGAGTEPTTRLTR